MGCCCRERTEALRHINLTNIGDGMFWGEVRPKGSAVRVVTMRT